MSGSAMVHAEDVWKSYGRLEVLRGVSLSVDTGEIVCLMGPSGSGKSTFTRCLNHLERIDAGELYVDGTLVGYERDRTGSLRELGDKEIARARTRIGMVFQNFNLFGHMTVMENIIEGPVRVREESNRVAVERARELLVRVGLEDKADTYPRQLSGGQQQRAAIARALAMRPKLMVFDEPTSALDPELSGEVLRIIRNLTRDGMTMLIVSHEVGFVREVADRVIIMDSGRIIESGSPVEVLDSPQHERTVAFLNKMFET